MFADYKAWAEDQGIDWPMTQVGFGHALADRQIIRCGRGTGGIIMRRGARLRSRWDEASAGAGSAEGSVMRRPPWQEIEAEAQRRGRLESDTTGRRWTLAEKIVEVMNEGWKPPPAVDPDILAFREWSDGHFRLGDFDRSLMARAFLAGARMATERERERAKVLEAYVKLDEHGPHLWTRERARKVLAKYRGEA